MFIRELVLNKKIMDDYVFLEEKIINTLLEINNLAPQQCYDKLANFCDFSKESILWIIGRNLYHVGFSNPKYLLSLADLAVIIKNSLNDEYKVKWEESLEFSIISISYEDGEMYPTASSHESIYFYGLLARRGLFSISSKIKQTFEIFHDKTSFQKLPFFYSILPLFASQAKIINDECPEIIKELLDFFKERDLHIYNEINNSIMNYKESIILTPCTLSSFPLDSDIPFISHETSFQLAFSFDDFDWIQQFFVNTNLSIDYRIHFSISTPSELLLNEPPLICCSAFYGAVRCFKFLVMNGASLYSTDLASNPMNVSHFATVGGSLEIFRLCEQKVTHDDQCAFYAVSYWKTDIIEWILQNDDVDLSSCDNNEDSFMCCAASTNNIPFTKYLLSNGIKFWDETYEDMDDASPLELACQWDCLSIVMLMCNSLNFQLPQNLFEKIFIVTVEFNGCDILDYLFEHFKSQITDALISEAKEIIKVNHLSKINEILERNLQTLKSS